MVYPTGWSVVPAEKGHTAVVFSDRNGDPLPVAFDNETFLTFARDLLEEAEALADQNRAMPLTSPEKRSA